MKNLTDRVVVITGASSGIGKATALKFAKAGANLVLAARRKNALNDLVKQCERHGGRAIAVETDVSDKRDMEKLFKKALSEFGEVHVFVNNAGVATYGRFDEIPLDEHRQVVNTNLMGTLYGSYEALHHFRERGDGVLINVASFVGRGSSPYHSSYVASKHGIRGLDMSVRQELWANNEKNIRVCTVMPVSIDTPFFQHAANHLGKPVLPIPPVYPVDEAANTIFNLALNPQDEVTVGRAGKFFSLQGKFAPKLTEKQMAWQTQRTEMGQRRSASETSGSLYRPMQTGTDVSGGWLNRRSPRDLPGETETTNGRGTKVASSIAAFAAPAVLGWLLYSQRGSRREQPPQVA